MICRPEISLREAAEREARYMEEAWAGREEQKAEIVANREPGGYGGLVTALTLIVFSPVVSGSCQIFWGSLPAMHAAVEAAIAPAAPEVIIPDSAPVSSASLRPTARCSSIMLTKYRAASV